MMETIECFVCGEAVPDAEVDRISEAFGVPGPEFAEDGELVEWLVPVDEIVCPSCADSRSLAKLRAAQEERRARTTATTDGIVIGDDDDTDEYAAEVAEYNTLLNDFDPRLEQGLDVEVAEAEARSDKDDESPQDYFARKLREGKAKKNP
jgi:hypothetical protein